MGEMTIGLMVYRGFYFRAFDSSGILQSGFWFIGEFVIGVLVYRRFGYRAFDLSGFCYRANGHRAFSYRPYVVLPIDRSGFWFIGDLVIGRSIDGHRLIEYCAQAGSKSHEVSPVEFFS